MTFAVSALLASIGSKLARKPKIENALKRRQKANRIAAANRDLRAAKIRAPTATTATTRIRTKTGVMWKKYSAKDFIRPIDIWKRFIVRNDGHSCWFRVNETSVPHGDEDFFSHVCRSMRDTLRS